MKAYQLFRVLCFLCVAAVASLFVLNHVQVEQVAVVGDQTLANGAAATAAFAAIFGIFSVRPVERDVVAKTITVLDQATLQRVREGQLRQEEIQAFIEVKSSEIFLTTMKTRLEAAILAEYDSSGLPALVGRLIQIEQQLDGLDVKYTTIELPDRFKKILRDIEARTNADAYERMLRSVADAIPFVTGRAVARLGIEFVRALRLVRF